MSTTPPSRGRPAKQARSAARKAAMRDAAARLLIDLGPAAITHRRVAEAAAVPAGSAAYYYPSREDLYAAAVEQAEHLRSTAAQEMAAGLPEQNRSHSEVARLLIEAWYAPVNRPGVSGGSDCWEGWSHVRKYDEEVSG